MGAAKTPAAVYNEVAGSVRLIIMTFTDIDDADTYTSEIDGVITSWFQTSTTTGVVGVTESLGVFTFAASASNQVGTLFILARG